MEHRPLRIAMFSDSALPVLNGVSISVDALISELRRRGHSVVLFAPKFPGHRDENPNTVRMPSIDSPLTRGYPFAIPPFYPTLHRFRRRDFDLIHTHTPFILGMVGLRWAESHELPIVSTYHTLYDRYAHYFPILPRRYIRFRIAKHTNFYYNHVQHVITPTEASLKWLRRHSVSTPTTIIPTGMIRYANHDRATTRQSLGIPPETRLLLYVGRLAKEKNLQMLLTAVRDIMQVEANARLWLVGDGPYRDECERLARKLGIGDKVRFVGFVPREKVEMYYAAADLFVFASITETQGLVVQEAMVHGIPPVAVFGGGASDAIVHGENGFVVKNDVDSFARQAIDLLLDDRLYAEISDGAKRAGREWGVGAMAERVLSVYDHVLDTPARIVSAATITPS